jgi:hypothetical protein
MPFLNSIIDFTTSIAILFPKFSSILLLNKEIMPGKARILTSPLIEK